MLREQLILAELLTKHRLLLFNPVADQFRPDLLILIAHDKGKPVVRQGRKAGSLGISR